MTLVIRGGVSLLCQEFSVERVVESRRVLVFFLVLSPSCLLSDERVSA